jgi:hypothetical protein
MGRILIESCDRLNIYDMMRDNKNLNKETIFNSFINIAATITVKSIFPKAERTITTSLLFTNKPGTFGGIRLYLECPQCRRAVTDYYLPHINSQFLCRHCHNLAYSSQNRHRESWWEKFHKLNHKQKKIQRKLKNKWLRKPTKTKLVLKFEELYKVANNGLHVLLSKRFGKR